MTEAEWLACEDPGPMLESLRGWASDRKLRLFAVACCRRIWHLLEVGPSRDAVTVAERHADNECSDDDLEAANGTAHGGISRLPYGDGYWADPACMVTHADPWETAHCVEFIVSRRMRSELKESRTVHCDYLRDIIGNPFDPIRFRLALPTSTVQQFACTIYIDRAFDALPILADALEEAGCTDADLLSHLRDPGPHVRGCWALDLILGRE